MIRVPFDSIVTIVRHIFAEQENLGRNPNFLFINAAGIKYYLEFEFNIKEVDTLYSYRTDQDVLLTFESIEEETLFKLKYL